MVLFFFQLWSISLCRFSAVHLEIWTYEEVIYRNNRHWNYAIHSPHIALQVVSWIRNFLFQSFWNFSGWLRRLLLWNFTSSKLLNMVEIRSEYVCMPMCVCVWSLEKLFPIFGIKVLACLLPSTHTWCIYLRNNNSTFNVIIVIRSTFYRAKIPITPNTEVRSH